MKYLIISTYPEFGSQNVGDKLIEASVIELIKSQDARAEFEVIWRQDNHDNTRNSLNKCDVVVFACLAIRPNMRAVYSTIDIILESQKPLMILAAGTALAVMSREEIAYNYNGDDLNLLRKVADKSIAFTTRGRLTHTFCNLIGIDKAEYTGDVAFFDERFAERVFDKKKVQSIIISSPHRENLYVKHTEDLIEGLRQRFPDAEMAAAIHGKESEKFSEISSRNGLAIHECYKKPESGLEVYDDYDMHVGFRVHGHVSALKRRKISYLLEQDGRGVDYGLSLSRKITVPAMSVQLLVPGLYAKLARRLHYNKQHYQPYVPGSSILEVLSLIDRDIEGKFNTFVGLETEIENICKSLLNCIALSLNQLRQ